MLARHIFLVCLLCTGLVLNGIQFNLVSRKKRMNNYDLLVAHMSALKLLCITALLVIIVLAVTGKITLENFGPGDPVFNAVWCTVSVSVNQMLFVSIDRILIIKIAIRYHLLQQSRKRYFLVALYWACNLLSSIATFFPNGAKLRLIMSVWCVFAVKVTIFIHILILRRLISKKCMLHILKVNNKRVMVGECTPREKRIINTSLWSLIPFIACNLPFCIANLCGHYSLYLEVAVLVDAGVIGPCIWFFFSHSQRERNVGPQRETQGNPAVPVHNEAKNGDRVSETVQ